MCNANGHPPGCMCGFGGEGHLGGHSGTVAHTSEYSTENICRPTTCPICSAEVFFVRHNGGSVWFDSLGHPWPKHPCFDNQKEHSQNYAKLSFGLQHLKNPLLGVVSNTQEKRGEKYLFIQAFKDLEFKLSVLSKLQVHSFLGELVVFSLEDNALMRPYISNSLVKIKEITKIENSKIPKQNSSLLTGKTDDTEDNWNAYDLNLIYLILGYTYHVQDGKIHISIVHKNYPTEQIYVNHSVAFALLIPSALESYMQEMMKTKKQIEQLKKADAEIAHILENVPPEDIRFSFWGFDILNPEVGKKIVEQINKIYSSLPFVSIRINISRLGDMGRWQINHALDKRKQELRRIDSNIIYLKSILGKPTVAKYLR